MLERIHKILAHAGYGSRRACEEIVEEGRVTVNGKAAKVGDKADLQSDDLRVDGHRVRPEPKVYYILNKPTGYLSTNSDPLGRRKVADLLPGLRQRVYPVGRLDADSRGLVLMTNDGELADLLTHPSYEAPKTYEVEVDGLLSGDEAEKLVGGVWLSEGRTAPARMKVLKRGRGRTLLEITLREGRNRQVRRMLARLGHKVRSLTRTRIGNVSLHGLGPGKFRALTAEEIASLQKLARDEQSTVGGAARQGGKSAAATGDKRKAAPRGAKADGGSRAGSGTAAAGGKPAAKGPAASGKGGAKDTAGRGGRGSAGPKDGQEKKEPHRTADEFDVTM